MNVNFIKVPIDYAGGIKGSSLGPDCICNPYLIQELSSLGFRIKVCECPVATIDPLNIENPNAKYVTSVVNTNTKLAQLVENVLATKSFSVVVGGDHSVFLGSIAGVSSYVNKHFGYDKNVGVIYIDAHADFNTSDTSPTGNIHGQPVAASCGIGLDALKNIYFNDCKIRTENIIYIGVRDIDKDEKELLKEYNINTKTATDIERYGIKKIIDDSITGLMKTCDWLHVSFDIDAVDPIFAPGTSIQVPGGITNREIICAMEILGESNYVKSLDVVEYNPLKDISGKSLKLIEDCVLTLFGKRQF